MARALIPNSTQIPDVILDHWMADLSGAEFKVLLYIARRTYGFGKDRDAISLTQIAQGLTRRDGSVLDRGTGISRVTVARAVRALEERGVVVRQTNLSESGREFEENTYRINLGWGHGGEIPPGTPSDASRGEPDPGGGGVVAKCNHPPSEVGEGVVSKGNHLVAKRHQGWLQNAAGVVSKVDTQETVQETDQETAAATTGSGGAEGAAADASLVGELVAHGVGRSVAEALAGAKPEVCKRCLEYLPFAKVRTTKGAWLADAIQREYGPPKGYLEARRGGGEGARDQAGQAGTAPYSQQEGRGATIEAQARATYARLQKTRPEAITAFSTFLARERQRAEQFAARLSPKRQEGFLTSLGGDEHLFGHFRRWLSGEGRRYLL